MSDKEELYRSYRQSLREFWWIAGAWGVFLIWNLVAGSLFAFRLPEPDQIVATIWGIPRWVFVTVLLPWLIGNVFIGWFAIKMMKDTKLTDE